MYTSPTAILPPEWAPQSGVMLTWPHRHSDWLPWLEQVEPVFVSIAMEITRFERLLVTCYDDTHRRHVTGLLQDAGVPLERARLYECPSNDTWVRDHGPLTVIEQSKPMLLDFTFNGWGGKFDARLDDAITRALHDAHAFDDTPLRSVPLVLEGGSIEVDGDGGLLTTSRCLLSATRNPQLDRAGVERALGTMFGVDRFLWLEHGYLAGDDTDSHIDTLARFCDAQTIAYVRCNDDTDEHYAALKAMEVELQGFRTRTGAPYRLVPLPWPAARHGEDGRRLPATYANFLIVNGAVLVPTYDDPADAQALQTLAGCFPDREVVGIHCLPLIRQYGSLHCVTMQLPAGVL